MPKTGLKVLIDSGGSDSIITPKAATYFDSSHKYKKHFTLTSMKITQNHFLNIKTPLLKEYNINEPICICIRGGQVRNAMPSTF